MAGVRERYWGVRRRYTEGGIEQVLDTLFFEFIALAKRLQPKVVVADNVKGLMMGKARKYVDRIRRELDDAGYSVRVVQLRWACPNGVNAYSSLGSEKTLRRWRPYPLYRLIIMSLRYIPMNLPITRGGKYARR